MKSLALIQVSTYGAALEAANVATHRSGLELTEIIPFGTYAQLLLQGSYQDLVSFRKILRTADLQKSVIIAEPEPSLLKAYYHLENKKPEEYLLILEDEFAGYLLQWVQTLLKRGLSVCDFRQPRFPGAFAVVVMTGRNIDLIQEELRLMESQKMKVSFVEEMTAGFRKYFDIEP